LSEEREGPVYLDKLNSWTCKERIMQKQVSSFWLVTPPESRVAGPGSGINYQQGNAHPMPIR
jgi:hypothetical protein